MYILTITTLNPNADGAYFNKWLYSNYPTANGMAYTDIVQLYFTSEPSEADKTTITDKYASLTADDVLVLENIIKVYHQRTDDGIDYYNQVRGTLALQYNAGTLSIEDANYIEVTKLSVVKSLLITGDWATAQYEMDNNVVTNGTVSQTDIDNGFTQAIYDDIKAGIDAYVTEHY
jgi:hypothetical protein